MLVWLTILSAQILDAGSVPARQRADVAIVLGAAVYGEEPSPVFEERIRHGISLYKSKTVDKLIFTGGYGAGAKAAEATVARRYAIAHGIPSGAILTETLSRTTRQNLVQARRIMNANAMHSALIVTDPLHLKRALRMASDLGMKTYAAPTPTSRYRSWRTKAGFLLRELYFYNHYLVTGH